MKRSFTFLTLAALLATGCPSAQRAGWVATAATIDARDAIDDGIRKAFRARARACFKEYAPDEIKAQQCFTGSREYRAALIWIRGAKDTPGIWDLTNSAVKAAKAALEIAEGRQDSSAKTLKAVLGILKDAACSLAAIVSDYGDLFPAGAKEAAKYLELVKVACKR